MTSKDLLRKFPFLKETPGWGKFAEAFDKPECVKKRDEAKRAHEGAEPSQIVLDLHKLINRIPLEFTSGMGFLVDWEKHDISAEETQRVFKAAVALSKVLLLFMGDSKGGKLLRNAAEQEAERNRLSNLERAEQETRMGHEAYLALCSFVDREKRLPSKKELNLEAGRNYRANRVIESPAPFPHGQKIEHDGIWRVQRSELATGVTWFGAPEKGVPSDSIFDGVFDCYEIHLVDCSSGDRLWNKLRWEENTMAKNVTPVFGFSGLPRHRNP
jgi:hypothetical protein